MKPKNWMPSGSAWRFEQGGSLLICENDKTGERLEIFLYEVEHDIAWQGQMHGLLLKVGMEKEMSDLLATQLWRIDDNLELIAREFRTDAGAIDLLSKYKGKKELLVIEVKRAKVSGPEVPYQLVRYMDALKRMSEYKDYKISGILAAPSISRPAQALADELCIPFRRIYYEEMRIFQANNP
jgi:RecB family endonuclease NucS